MEQFPNLTEFLDKLFEKLMQAKIDVSELHLDHICYRVETVEEYEKKKRELENIGTLLLEISVNNRPISTYKLKNPIIYKEREIWLFELPSPKEGSSYKDGFQHVEFIIEEPFAEFMKKYPHLEFDTKGLTKEINPELAVKLGDGIGVKFHHQHLEKICEMQKRLSEH